MPAPAVIISTETSPPPRSSPTDTGPVFLAGIASSLDHSIVRDPIALPEALRFANAVGAIATTRHGAIPALPDRKQVDALLRTMPF